MGKMYINLVHRAENDAALMESVRFQQEECHRLGLKTTLLIGYPAMCNKETAEYVRMEGKRADVELGISLHDIVCDELEQEAGTAERVLYLMRMPARKRVIHKIFTKFQELFGYIPSAVGGYIIDAETLAFIKEEYPQVKAAITNCFEEGVKMFAGNCNGWMLFSDGGPWGAYYPSKENHLVPAASQQDYVGIVGLPHLNRDMVLSLTSRDDYFASHPINIMRAKACRGKDSSYAYYFFDQWVEQAAYNGYSYYNVFVSSAWITRGYQTLFVDNYLDARAMYSDALEYYRKNCDEGITACVTMSEFASWFEENVPIGTPEVNLWKEILCGTKRQNYWYVDSSSRIVLDMNQGGTITDLRPYAARWDNRMGPDTKALYNGSNPFVISLEHRNAEASCRLGYKGKNASVKDKRTQGKAYKDAKGNHVLEVSPLIFDFDGDEITLYSRFIFQKEGSLRIERKAEGIAENETLSVTEYFKGCYGTNQYPENLNGAILYIQGQEQAELTFQYDGRRLTTGVPSGRSARAGVKLPQINTEMIWNTECGSETVGVEEGILFEPYYTLNAEGRLRNGEVMTTCLQIKKL